jgi:hypothetical protein
MTLERAKVATPRGTISREGIAVSAPGRRLVAASTPAKRVR